MLDVYSGGEYPADVLSNFTANDFEFDGVQCRSMEGLLTSFKFERVDMQREVCKNVGLVAHNRGKGMSKRWQKVQQLWWNGETYDRHGPEYQALLDRAYQALWDQSLKFRQALYDSGTEFLAHRMGSTDPRETILTQAEFCTRLMALRQKIWDHIILQDAFERHG